MKVIASISLELAKKFIKTSRKRLLAKYGTDDPIEKLFQKYGYGRSKQKYRIILKTDGSPDVSRNIVVPRDILDFLQVA